MFDDFVKTLRKEASDWRGAHPGVTFGVGSLPDLLDTAAHEIECLRAAMPAPKLVVPETMPIFATKGDLLEVDEKLDQHFDSRCDQLSRRLDALEQRYDLERRQNEVVRDWTEWHRVDPERAERWRREHVRSIDDLG